MLEQDTYQVRSVIGASDAYRDVMRLELIAGREPAAGTHDVLISESLADVLFGSPVAALGQPMQTAKPRLEIRGDAAADFIRRDMPAALYTVRGVFPTPTSCGAASTASPTCWSRSGSTPATEPGGF